MKRTHQLYENRASKYLDYIFAKCIDNPIREDVFQAYLGKEIILLGEQINKNNNVDSLYYLQLINGILQPHCLHPDFDKTRIEFIERFYANIEQVVDAEFKAIEGQKQ